MALQEVKKFITYIKDNREALEKYNEKLLETGSYMFMDPALMTESYTPLTTIPDNPEDDILEEIFHIDDKQQEEAEKEANPAPKKEGLGEKIANKWDEFVEGVVFDGKSKEERLEERRHRLFGKLAEIAKDEDFDVTQDDLEYYIGQSVEKLIEENPDDDAVQILEKLLDSFAEKENKED